VHVGAYVNQLRFTQGKAPVEIKMKKYRPKSKECQIIWIPNTPQEAGDSGTALFAFGSSPSFYLDVLDSVSMLRPQCNMTDLYSKTTGISVWSWRQNAATCAMKPGPINAEFLSIKLSRPG
jgi:hypothetical protein